MNKIVATIVLMLCTLVANAGNDANIPATASPVKIRIIGDIDTASRTSSLWIIRQNDNIRNPAAEVPIVNGKIDYTFQTSEPDMFSMISKQDLFNGSWMNFDFFAEDGEIHISGKENENKKLELKLTRTTTPLNRQLIEYIEDRNLTFYPRMDSISELINQIPRDECYSPAGKAFWQEFETLSECIKQHPDSLLLLQLRSDMYKKSMEMEKERTMRSAEYYRLSDASRDINNERMEYETEKYGTPDGNLFAMSVLFKNFMWYEDNSSLKKRIIDLYTENFRDRFTGTAIGRRMQQAVTGYEVSHVGGRYPNYELPDAEGNIHQIKNLISGKLALIDLWGSTCGPCRVNSRSLIPIYNNFKDKGFEIIGIAREYSNLDRFHHAVKEDGYPWQQLIELDDATGVFNLHGIPNAMGGTYLVGPDNRILLISPTPTQLRDYLTKYYTNF